ncbi:MAG: 6-bladed beta-propeller [bacterium]
MLRNYFLLVLMFFISCSYNNPKVHHDESLKTKHKNTIVKINLPQKGEKQLNTSEFADTILYIPLETKPQSLIRRIIQVQIIEDKILMNCFDKMLLFSNTGKFIRQIGKNGKGPGEYLIIFNFNIINDTILISTTGKRSILKYTLEGKYLGEQQTKSQFSRWTITPTNEFVVHDYIHEKLIFYNQFFKVSDTINIQSDIHKNRGRYGWWDTWDTFFQYGNGKLYFTNYLSDTIWNISSGKKEVGYILNIKNKLLPNEYQVEYFDGDEKKFRQKAAPFQKVNLFETPSYLFLFQKGWVENMINSIYLHDFDKNYTRKFEGPFIVDDIISGGNQKLIPRFTTNDCIIATINPIHLKEDLKSFSAKDAKSAAWLEQMKTVKEEDNQILVIIPVRKH